MSVLRYTDPVHPERPGPARPRLQIDLPCLGTVRPRGLADTLPGNWLLGCETLDRDYADYDQYKEYLAPLGIRRIRLQGGWAKCEPQPGVYRWEWLDHILKDAVARGLQPWLQLGYGNPAYPGAGGWNLGAGMPLSESGRATYLTWVEKVAVRYAPLVRDWEVWNEPNFGDNPVNTPEITAELNRQTAAILRRVQPDARISALAMGHIDMDYAERFFRALAPGDAWKMFDNVTYHDYAYNPDANHLAVYRLRQIVAQYAPGLRLRQGENGAPSAPHAGGALHDYGWTEISQAKWDLRRMLDNLGQNIECSVFSIAEMQYHGEGPINRTNTKGLLQTDEKNRVLRPKPAYFSVQQAATLLDGRLTRLPGVVLRHTLDGPFAEACCQSSDRSLALYGYRDKVGRRLYTYWRDDAIPGDSLAPASLTLTFQHSGLQDPVIVDLLSGCVYEWPATRRQQAADGDHFCGLPVYDSPILLAERGLVPIEAIVPGGEP